MMVCLHIRVNLGSMMDVIQKFGRGIKFPAPLATLQRMRTDDLVTNGYGADLFSITDFNHIGGADIGASAATDTRPFDRYDEILFVAFFHFKGGRADNLLAHPYAEAATDTAVRRRPGVDVEAAGQRSDSL